MAAPKKVTPIPKTAPKPQTPGMKNLKEKESKKSILAFDRSNYMWMLIGIGLLALGYVLMIGGGTKDPNVFDGDALFSFRRLTLAPIVILAGFVVEIYAIMKKPAQKSE